MKPTYKVKTLPKSYQKQLDKMNIGNFHKSGSIIGMKQKLYGKDSKLVRCGNYIYNVTQHEHLYNIAK